MISVEQKQLTFRLIMELIEDKAYHNCVNCANFDLPNDICDKAGIRPPTKVIVVGCEKWEDIIPF